MKKQATQNQENMEKLQISIYQMIKLFLLQTKCNKRTDESSKNSWKSRLNGKSGTSGNTASSSIKRKGGAAKLAQAKNIAVKKAVENISVAGSNIVKLEEIELATGKKPFK